MKKLVLVALTILGAQSVQAQEPNYSITPKGWLDESGNVILPAAALQAAGLKPVAGDLTRPAGWLTNTAGNLIQPIGDLSYESEKGVVDENGTTIITNAQLKDVFDYAKENNLGADIAAFLKAANFSASDLEQFGFEPEKAGASDEAFDWLGREWRWLDLTDTTK